VLLFLCRQIFALLKQELGPHQPDAVDGRGVDMAELGKPGHIDHELDLLAACGRYGCLERGSCRPRLHLLREATVIIGAEHGVGIDDQCARIAVEHGIGAAR
jgi:hypothetical protein